MCRNTAPEFFKRDNESGYSIVYRQPQTPAEVELAEDALSGCPTESIGNDGEAARMEGDTETSVRSKVLQR